MYFIYLRDAQGQTPFMLAVSCRAYHAALCIFDTIQRHLASQSLAATGNDESAPSVASRSSTPNAASSVTSTEEKIKSVLSAWFAKGE